MPAVFSFSEMNTIHSRTTNEEIKQLIHFLQYFRPNELEFLLDVSRRWSRFDPDRIKKITSLLNKTLNTEQTIDIVQHTLAYFTNNTSLGFTHNFSAMELIGHQLNPFRLDCPVCGSELDVTRARIKHVKMYSLKGQMVEGEIYLW